MHLIYTFTKESIISRQLFNESHASKTKWDTMNKPKRREEHYSVGDAEAQRKYLGQRTAKEWVGFFLPHLKAGMNVLDCGCGVGSITLDLARRVLPGNIVGIDLDKQQLDFAESEAARRGVNNVRFEQASVYKLPFPDSTFDAVLAHTLLLHLNDPPKALKEMRRVLKKPRGVIGVFDDDFGSFFFSPSTPLLEKATKLLIHIIEMNGGSPFYSRNLRHLLLEAGFSKTEGHAVAAEYYGTLEETKRFADAYVRVIRGQLETKKSSSNGYDDQFPDQKLMEEIITEVEMWGNRPDAFHAVMYCAAVGWT
ncbi:MAG: class I SAM-dependent methyltransferase [Nitrososphaerales archaeon]